MKENNEKQKEKLPSAKDHLLLQQIIMLVKDMDCENDFSLHNNTLNRQFKDGTIRNTMKVSHEFRKEYEKHEFIDN